MFAFFIDLPQATSEEVSLFPESRINVEKIVKFRQKHSKVSCKIQLIIFLTSRSFKIRKKSNSTLTPSARHPRKLKSGFVISQLADTAAHTNFFFAITSFHYFSESKVLVVS